LRILKVNREIKFKYDDEGGIPYIILEKDVEYVVADVMSMTIRKNNLGDSILTDVNFYDDDRIKKRVYSGETLFGKKLITFRNGGIGDLIFQLPAMKELKDTYNKNVELTLCCNEQYLDIFKNIEYVDNIITLPLKLELLLSHDYFVNFEGLIESSDRAKFINAYDLHAEKFFVKPKDMNPKLQSDEEHDKIVLREIDKSKTNIVIAFQSSALIRAIHPDLYANMIAEIGVDYPNVKFYICGTKNQSKQVDELIKVLKEQAKVFNCVNWSKKYSDLGMTISLIKHSNGVISPDSGLLHVAGGFEIPVIGLYGAFPSKLRIGYYKNAIGLDSMSNCIFGEGNEYKSCFQHGVNSCKSAIKNAELFSPCMNVFRPSDIIDAMKELKILK
jgi:ADP-heptose:LPS heptosyltransferase